uniref:BHLH domain-containing protein n=1 Tax=Kalanchoe fedtschenkoi TaxID=63787 RepID=A0A7N0RDC7_KALFE
MDGRNKLPGSSVSSTDRKTTEKNRRNQMKSLYAELSSLVPHYTTKADAAALPDKLDEAARYIKKLQVSLEKLRQKKEKLQGGSVTGASSAVEGAFGHQNSLFEPHIDVHRMGSALEVVLVTGLDHQFALFTSVLRALHEEGAEVGNASFYVASDKVFHIIHSKVRTS